MSLLSGKRVLVVEDTTIAATYLARELTNMGATVVGLARSEQQALDMVKRGRPELILMDIHLADGGNGIEAARRILEIEEIPVVYTTSYSDDTTVSKALETSPYGYIVKPFDSKMIRVSCETALNRFALEQKIISSEKRFRVAAEAAQFGVMELKENGKMFSFDGAASLKNRFGAGTEMPIASFLALLDKPDDGDIITELKDQTSIRHTIRLKEEGKESLWLDIVFSEVVVRGDTVSIGAVIDVTDRQRKIRKLQLSNVILDQLAEGVAVLDRNMVVRDLNRAMCDLLHVDPNRLVGAHLSDFGLPPSLIESIGDDSSKQNVIRHKGSLLRADGGEFPAFVTLTRLEKRHGELGYIATVSDTSELTRAEKRLETLAFTDQLTGAGNRNYLKLILNESVYSGNINALIFIDIDGFKLVNDTYGHETGDELLADCASKIKKLIREEDVFIRHGGDEFIILVQDEGNAELLGERLLAVFDEPVVVDDKTLKISASIGLAEANQSSTPSDLLKQADIAMYEAKRRGKNQVVKFSIEQNEAIEYRLYLEQGLYNALLNKELHASFQPIVDADKNIVALEALCRWRSHDIGDIHPSSFIPIAEETGLINAVGLKMLREVCIARALLRESGLSHIRLHVNVSILQLNSPLMAKQFLDYLADFNVKPQDIILEVTESAMHDIHTRRVLKDLSHAGFGIAIDDFGAGFASVSELAEPFTTMVKIDKSLAPSDGTNVQKNIIAEHLIQLCNKLGKEVLLEGIESDTQADFAREAGCTFMQGYLFARPMSLMQVISLIRRQQEPTEELTT